MNNSGFQTLGDIFEANKENKVPVVKPPAHKWQDFALQIIKELHIPDFKRNSVFKICKDNSREVVEGCVTDTKELCETGEQWKYFFKVVADRLNKIEENKKPPTK